MTGTEDRSSRADFPEFYRKPGRWIPTTSDESAVPTGAILTGSELALTFDRPEVDATASLAYMEARDSGVTDDPEDDTLIQRLECWARDREYDFTRVTRPEYVEGYRDAQSVVLGLIQAWDEPRGEPSDAQVTEARRAYRQTPGTGDDKMRAALRAAWRSDNA